MSSVISPAPKAVRALGCFTRVPFFIGSVVVGIVWLSRDPDHKRHSVGWPRQRSINLVTLRLDICDCDLRPVAGCEQGAEGQQLARVCRYDHLCTAERLQCPRVSVVERAELTVDIERIVLRRIDNVPRI